MPVVAASSLPGLQQAMQSNCRVASASVAPCLCLQFHLLPGVPCEHWCALAVVACVALLLLVLEFCLECLPAQNARRPTDEDVLERSLPQSPIQAT